MRILVINPGATSTKIAVFDGDKEAAKKTIDHDAGALLRRRATGSASSRTRCGSWAIRPVILTRYAPAADCSGTYPAAPTG